MSIKKEKMLLKLQDVLRVKNYSNDVKEQIRNLLINILDMDIEEKEKHIESIIKGLKKIDTFKIDTRKQLMKNETIKRDLRPDIGGYVKIDSNLAVVVKEFQDQATLYHELVHVSQNENSYNIKASHYMRLLLMIEIRKGIK